MTRSDRLAEANHLILEISAIGRRFFYSEPHDRVACFERSVDGKLWFRDDYTGRRIYVAYRGEWRHFSHGGTLRRLVEGLAGYIRTGERIPAGHFGPWPEYYFNGDLWGYGKEAMSALRGALRGNDCVAWPAREATA